MRIASLLILLVSFSAFGATVYCGPSNTGGGTGADFNNLLQLPTTTGFTRGNTYIIVDGSYGSRTLSEAVSSTTLVTIKKASSADSAVAGYVSTVHDGQATFTSFTINTDYWFIDGMTRTESDWRANAYGIRTTDISSIDDFGSVFAAKNVTLRYIDGGGADGTSYTGSEGDNVLKISGFRASAEDWTIQYCRFHNSAHEAALHLNGLDGALIEYCSIDYNWGKEGIRGQIVFANVTVRYNVFLNSAGNTGIPGEGATADIAAWDETNFDGNEIYGNIFIRNSGDGNSGGAIVVGGNGGSWAGAAANNCLIYNNTLVGYSDASTSSLILINGGTGNEARNNLWYDCFGTISCTPNTSNNSEESSDPFVNYAGLNLHLSAALSGTSLSSPYNTDMDGVTRGGDGVFDRGAFEYNAAAPPTPNAPRVHIGIRGFRGF